MTAPRLTAQAVTRLVRTATGSDLFTSSAAGPHVVRVSQRYAVAGALAAADTRDRRETRARLAAAALVQAGYEVARTGDRLTVTLPEPVEETAEADVPPSTDERVTVRIRARELRAGDEVVDSLGERQYAAFDTDAGTHIVDGRLVRVWTAIRDQEAGLPPVITVPAGRELLVLRPLSDEGRELLAVLDRS